MLFTLLLHILTVYYLSPRSPTPLFILGLRVCLFLIYLFNRRHYILLGVGVSILQTHLREMGKIKGLLPERVIVCINRYSPGERLATVLLVAAVVLAN